MILNYSFHSHCFDSIITVLEFNNQDLIYLNRVEKVRFTQLFIKSPEENYKSCAKMLKCCTEKNHDAIHGDIACCPMRQGFIPLKYMKFYHVAL